MAFEFERNLPPGVSCQLTVKPVFKFGPGASITSTSSYQFNSGGPFVQNVLPGSYKRIDEEQYFVRQLNGAVALKSVQDNISCAVERLGERVPVTLLEGSASRPAQSARAGQGRCQRAADVHHIGLQPPPERGCQGAARVRQRRGDPQRYRQQH